MTTTATDPHTGSFHAMTNPATQHATSHIEFKTLSP